ncbi:MAG TPA: metallophosphoesterase [Solimonas sp.]
MILLHLSDPHFGTEQPSVVDALRRLAQREAPDVLILSGDITQRATAGQFDSARRFVERLGIERRLVLPGNHDIPLLDLWTRWRHPYARYRKAFGSELEPVLRTPSLLALGVNTTRAYRHKDGEVSAEQIERVAARLRKATTAQLRIVVTHQPAQVIRERDLHNRLHGHAEAIRTWTAAGADLILGGHIHLPYVAPLHERDATLSRRAWCVQAGTAVSSRIRLEAPNSINLIRYTAAPLDHAAHCAVERWDYDATRQAFQLASCDTLVLSRHLPAAAEEASPI